MVSFQMWCCWYDFFHVISGSMHTGKPNVIKREMKPIPILVCNQLSREANQELFLWSIYVDYKQHSGFFACDMARMTQRIFSSLFTSKRLFDIEQRDYGRNYWAFHLTQSKYICCLFSSHWNSALGGCCHKENPKAITIIRALNSSRVDVTEQHWPRIS